MEKKINLPVLCHYYDSRIGPFKNLSNLDPEEAEQLLEQIRREKRGFASQRPANYLMIRRELEALARRLFVDKGGKPRIDFPYTFTVGECDWLTGWYESPELLRFPLERFDPGCLSFSYGDIFPAFRYDDGKPYRKKIYTLDELKNLIEDYGFPQEWNPDGSRGPERYIEAQLWDFPPALD